MSEPKPTALRVAPQGPAIAFPAGSLDLAALRNPELMERARSEAAVTVRTVCRSRDIGDGVIADEWRDE